MNETSLTNPQNNNSKPRLSINSELLFFKNDLLSDLKQVEVKVTQKLKTENDENKRRIIQIENKLETLTRKIYDISNNNFDNTQLNEKVTTLFDFYSKLEKTIFSHDFKLSSISKELAEAINKFDRLIESSIIYQGIIGTNNARFQTFHNFIDYVLTNINHLISFRDKTLGTDFKQYKKKLDTMADGLKKQYDELLEKSKGFTSQCFLNLDKRIKNDFEIYSQRLFDLKLKNSEQCIHLEKITNNLICEWEKITVIKKEIDNTCDSTVKGLKKHYIVTEKRLGECIKDYNDIKKKFDLLTEFLKGIKANGVAGVGTRMSYHEFVNYKENQNQNEHKTKNQAISYLKKYIIGEMGMDEITELTKKQHRKKLDNANNHINNQLHSLLYDNNNINLIFENNNNITLSPQEMNEKRSIKNSLNNSSSQKMNSKNNNNIIINEKKMFNNNTPFRRIQTSYINYINNIDSNEEQDKKMINYALNDNSNTIIKSKNYNDNKDGIENNIKDLTINNNNNTITYKDKAISDNELDNEFPNKKNENSKIILKMNKFRNKVNSSDKNYEKSNDFKIIREQNINFNEEKKDKESSNSTTFILSHTNNINFLDEKNENNKSPSAKINDKNNNYNQLNDNDVNSNIDKINDDNKIIEKNEKIEKKEIEKNKKIINYQDKENNTSIKNSEVEISRTLHKKYYPTNKNFDLEESNFHFYLEHTNNKNKYNKNDKGQVLDDDSNKKIMHKLLRGKLNALDSFRLLKDGEEILIPKMTNLVKNHKEGSKGINLNNMKMPVKSHSSLYFYQNQKNPINKTNYELFEDILIKNNTIDDNLEFHYDINIDTNDSINNMNINNNYNKISKRNTKDNRSYYRSISTNDRFNDKKKEKLHIVNLPGIYKNNNNENKDYNEALHQIIMLRKIGYENDLYKQKLGPQTKSGENMRNTRRNMNNKRFNNNRNMRSFNGLISDNKLYKKVSSSQ